MVRGEAKIVVVEDNDEDFAMIRSGLAKAGINHPIERKCDVAEAEAWLANGGERAHMVLLDLNLPGGSGHQILKKLKDHPTHRTTPVVILSTSGNHGDVTECYKAGANSYHTKPLETPRFYAMVQKIAEYWFNYVLLHSAA